MTGICERGLVPTDVFTLPPIYSAVAKVLFFRVSFLIMPSKQPESPVSDTSNQPTRIRRAHQDSNEWPSQDMPPPEQRGAGRAAGGESPARGHASTATDFAMTPESSTRAAIGETDQKRYDHNDPVHHSTDATRREKADIDLYRQHFSEYRDDKAHLSANPYIESDARLEDGEHYHDFPGGKAQQFQLLSTPVFRCVRRLLLARYPRQHIKSQHVALIL